MLADVRFALRTFAKNPGFVAVAMIVLALGIGANTAIFSVVNAVLLRSLPFRDPDQLVMVWQKNPQINGFFAERYPVSLKNYVDWKATAQSFSAMSVYSGFGLTITGVDKPEGIQGSRAAVDFFDLFGVRPLMGRMFTVEETRRGQDHVVLISHSLFSRRFGGDDKILGGTIELDREKYTIIGVLPSTFQMPAMWEGFDRNKADVWLPLDTSRAQSEEEMEESDYFVYARLRPGVSLAQARAEMTTIGARIARDDPKHNAGLGTNVFPVRLEDVGPSVRRYVLLLQGAVGFVLLIACANVANLLLARSMGRGRELAVRLALGASRARLIRQMLAESMLLSLFGGALGLLLAIAGIRGVMMIAPEDTPHLDDLRLDGTTLLFTLGAVILTGFLFGLAPALHAARRNVNESLSQGGRGESVSISKRFRGLLVASEVALALVPLVCAGLLIRTVHEMFAADPGFRRDGLLTMRLLLADRPYPKEENLGQFCRELLERASVLPGVAFAGLASGLPLQSLQVVNYSVDGAPDRGNAKPATDLRMVSETYFGTMLIPIVRGRSFTRQEVIDASDVIVVNATFAKQVWPGQDPLGRAIRLYDKRCVVIGVAGDAVQLGPESPISPEVYLPSMRVRAPTLVLRVSSDLPAVKAALPKIVHQIDKDQPVHQIHTMDESMNEWTAERRFVTLLLGVFAGLALVLAAAGIYGVLAYSVSQRTREIGIRMAVGATSGDVLKLVIREGLRLAMIGVAVGIAGALALTRLMQSLLFGVSATDPSTFALGAVVLIAAAILASFLPARRATRVDPMTALRCE